MKGSGLFDRIFGKNNTNANNPDTNANNPVYDNTVDHTTDTNANNPVYKTTDGDTTYTNNNDLYNIIIKPVNYTTSNSKKPLGITRGPNIVQSFLYNQIGRVNILNRLIKQNKPPFHENDDNTIFEKNNKTIIYHIENGANIEAMDSDNRTPLLNATEKNNTEISRLLIERGAIIHVKDEDNMTPLLHATENNNTEISLLLIERGANINATIFSGVSPIFFASVHNNNDILRILINKDVKIPEDLSRRQIVVNAIKKLYSGENIEARDSDNRTPLLNATMNNNTEISRLLVDIGANVNVNGGDKNNTPLLWAAWNNNTEISQLLIDRGADIDAKNHDKETPLLYAAGHNNAVISLLLFEKGANIHAMSRYKQTPFLNANWKNNTEIIDIFNRKKNV
jgi:ankyrin repeat protein